MSDKLNLTTLKVGDEVGITRRLGTKCGIGTVAELTATTVFLMAGGRFSRKTGKEIGAGSYARTLIPVESAKAQNAAMSS